MRTVLVMFTALLVGCVPPMTNEEIGAAVAECESYGLQADSWRNLNGRVYEISCAPRRD